MFHAYIVRVKQSNICKISWILMSTENAQQSLAAIMGLDLYALTQSSQITNTGCKIHA